MCVRTRACVCVAIVDAKCNTSVFQSLIFALVLSRSDYCNRILFGLPANLIQRLQSVQNAAARLIFRIRRSEHITPALISLHWLRVSERISFKLAVMTYRSIHGISLYYIQSCFTRFAYITSRRWLRSLPHIVWTFRPFVSLQYSRQAGVSRHFCFPVPTKTLSYDSCVTITTHHYCLDTCGPCI